MSLALLYQLNLDVGAPSFSSATVAAGGTSVTLSFTSVIVFGAGGNGGFTLTPTNGGAAVTLTYSIGSGTANLVYSTSRTISSTETLTTAFTQPGDGAQDSGAQELGSYSAQSVTNSSTQNSAPTAISLSKDFCLDTDSANATVGTASATDADAGDTHTWSLVAGTGDTNNASFNFSGSTLRCNDPGVLGAGSYSVRIRATDAAANTYDQAVPVYVVTASAGSSGNLRSPFQSIVSSIVSSPVGG